MKLEYINLSRNSIANTSNWILFLPAFDVYVRSFLYLLYNLIKLYYTQTHTHTHTQKSLKESLLKLRTQKPSQNSEWHKTFLFLHTNYLIHFPEVQKFLEI